MVLRGDSEVPTRGRPGAPQRVVGQAREILRARTRMVEILAEHTGQSADRIRADIDRDTILTGADALAYGLVDELAPVRRQRVLARL